MRNHDTAHRFLFPKTIGAHWSCAKPPSQVDFAEHHDLPIGPERSSWYAGKGLGVTVFGLISSDTERRQSRLYCSKVKDSRLSM